jgi:hypothetical protein
VITLGVNCSTHCAFFAVAVNGELRDGHIEYIDAPTLAESSEEVNADKVVLLKPEGGPTPKKTHAAFVPRIALETLVRLAAVEGETEIEVLARPTVRKRLELPTKGPLAEHVPLRIPSKVGKNWSEERQLAALAALAADEARLAA